MSGLPEKFVGSVLFNRFAHLGTFQRRCEKFSTAAQAGTASAKELNHIGWGMQLSTLPFETKISLAALSAQKEIRMKNKSLPTGVFSLIAVSLYFLSTPYVVAITDVGTLGQKPRFVANTLLVKFTPQARANLKVTGEDVNPAATGLPSLDVICREHEVKSLRSIVNAGAHRNPAAAINSWHKLTLAEPEQRLTLVEQSNDDSLNVAFSGAGPLGRLMARLQQEPSVEAVALD